MSKFKQKEKRTVPQPPSGSLSDIVFMLLFFFMVTTTMRETESLVTTDTPSATEITKLERKDLTSTISVGVPKNSAPGSAPRIQFNDAIQESHKNINTFINQERNQLSESDQKLMTVAIKADKNVRMGIITDIKQELRRSSALKIMYVAKSPAQ